MFRNTHTCESNLPDVVGFIDTAADVAVDSWSAEDMIFFFILMVLATVILQGW